MRVFPGGGLGGTPHELYITTLMQSNLALNCRARQRSSGSAIELSSFEFGLIFTPRPTNYNLKVIRIGLSKVL